MMIKRFCKFCGQKVEDPCIDETDLSVYRRTVERCANAAFEHDAEKFYESEEAQP